MVDEERIKLSRPLSEVTALQAARPITCLTHPFNFGSAERTRTVIDKFEGLASYSIRRQHHRL